MLNERITVGLLTFLFVISCAVSDTWTDLNMPGLDNLNYFNLNGICGDKIIGSYRLNSDHQRYYGLIYNMSTGTWNTIDKPGVGSLGTEPRDIDGDIIVGSYYGTRWHGFIYNLSNQTWKTIDVPGTKSMQPYGIDGAYVVGYSWDGTTWSGFIYNTVSETYVTLTKQGAPHLYPTGISGLNITGRFNDGSWQGFIYNMLTQTYTTLSAPGASETIVRGIDGNLLVGYYNGGRSFLYNMTEESWTSLYNPDGSDNIFPEDIGAGKIIFSTYPHGSVYTLSGTLPVVPVCFAPIPGDLNQDCKVSFQDFVIMASHWLECNLQPPSACWD